MSELTVPDAIKMLRETFCVAQAMLGQLDDSRRDEHIARLQRLIADCDRQRPVGPDGKHGDRHTPTCGCGELTYIPRIFEVPRIPRDVTKLRDEAGRLWMAINIDGERTWRFMTLRFTDGTLLASIYGPTFTEVTS